VQVELNQVSMFKLKMEQTLALLTDDQIYWTGKDINIALALKYIMVRRDNVDQLHRALQQIVFTNSETLILSLSSFKPCMSHVV
jgi:hypothetical protein